MSKTHTSSRRIDASVVKAHTPILDVVREHVAKVERRGREYWACSPFKTENTASFSVDPGAGTFFCFATDQGGDVIRFIELIHGCDFHGALEILAKDGHVPMDAERQRDVLRQAKIQSDIDAARQEKSRQFREKLAKQIVAELEPAPGTLVETYLRARGIDCDALAKLYGAPVPPSLQFHPHIKYFYRDKGRTIETFAPAMVGLLTDPASGAVRGIHRTYLSDDGSEKAALEVSKLTLGEVWGSAGMLYPNQAPGAEWVMGEGYETTLTMMAALASRGQRVNGLSAVSLGNMVGGGMKGFRPRGGSADGKIIPSAEPNPERPGLVLTPPDTGCRTLIVLRDNDGKDPRAMDAMIARGQTKFQGQGWRVRVASPPVGLDFNDMVNRADPGQEAAA